MANKALVLTASALSNFGIIARPNRFGGGVGAFLPLKARKRRHNAGVSKLLSMENNMGDVEICEGLPKSENPLYLRAKEEALKIAKPFPILQSDFVETLAMVFEESEEITGGRAAELMERVTHLLKCLKVCHRHKLMREVMGLANKTLETTQGDGQ